MNKNINPMTIGSRRELFVDRLLIERLDNAHLKLHEPVSGGVSIRIDKPWEGPANGPMSVIDIGNRTGRTTTSSPPRSRFSTIRTATTTGCGAARARRPIALVYGRPGVQLLFCTDGKGEVWHTPMNLLPEPGEKPPAAFGRRGMATTATQGGHDDTRGNCTALKTGLDRFLVAYSDFRRHNVAGQRCKAICVREVKVCREENHD